MTGRSVRLRGRTRDRGCGRSGRGRVRRVTVAVAKHVRGRGRDRCRYLKRNGRFGRVRSCHRGRYLRARGRSRWRFRKRGRFRRGRYDVRVRAIDGAFNRERGRRKPRNTRRVRRR